MYDNLRRELERKNIAIVAVARLIGCSDKTVWNKLNGATDFTVAEAVTINDTLLPEFNFGYLFTRTA